MEQRYCTICKEYNCIAHARPNTVTQRLTSLLEYFEEPEKKDMRTYIEPDKKSVKNGASSSAKNDQFDRHDSRVNRVGGASSSFTESSLKDLSSVEEVKMMPRGDVTTTAIVHVGHTGSANKEFLSGPPKLQQLIGGRYKSHERHHFIKIHATSFVACASPTGAYSEIAVVLWVDNKSYSKSSVDRYRVVLSMMYDGEEDLWSISSKLIKRQTYSYSKDEEEGQISNRLCLTTELRSEIKKMLLYLGISPREAYRMFRRNMSEHFIVAKSEFGFTTVETASHAALLKDLEKTVPTSQNNWDNHRQHYSPHAGSYLAKNQARNHGQMSDKMYEQAIMGYDECWSSD
jgi:hypothetical protein